MPFVVPPMQLCIKELTLKEVHDCARELLAPSRCVISAPKSAFTGRASLTSDEEAAVIAAVVRAACSGEAAGGMERQVSMFVPATGNSSSGDGGGGDGGVSGVEAITGAFHILEDRSREIKGLLPLDDSPTAWRNLVVQFHLLGPTYDGSHVALRLANDLYVQVLKKESVPRDLAKIGGASVKDIVVVRAWAPGLLSCRHRSAVAAASRTLPCPHYQHCTTSTVAAGCCGRDRRLFSLVPLPRRITSSSLVAHSPPSALRLPRCAPWRREVCGRSDTR